VLCIFQFALFSLENKELKKRQKLPELCRTFKQFYQNVLGDACIFSNVELSDLGW